MEKPACSLEGVNNSVLGKACAAIRTENKVVPQIPCRVSRKIKQLITGDGWHLRNGKLAQTKTPGKAVKYSKSDGNRKCGL